MLQKMTANFSKVAENFRRAVANANNSKYLVSIISTINTICIPEWRSSWSQSTLRSSSATTGFGFGFQSCSTSWRHTTPSILASRSQCVRWSYLAKKQYSVCTLYGLLINLYQGHFYLFLNVFLCSATIEVVIFQIELINLIDIGKYQQTFI